MAAHAFGDWLWQRFTALFMLVYSLIFAARWMFNPPLPGAAAWKLWCSPWYFKSLSLLFLLALIYHAWLGMKEILMDYVPQLRIRNALQLVFAWVLAVYAVWAFIILWRI
ncbi:MAG: succinate dehydrogenase, hydrophobic membrane anchor protein [Methylophilaceae bacterium]